MVASNRKYETIHIQPLPPITIEGRALAHERVSTLTFGSILLIYTLAVGCLGFAGGQLVQQLMINERQYQQDARI